MVRTIKTEIEINASPQLVWEILTNFEKFPEWNPLIRRLEGDVVLGNQIEVDLKSGEDRTMTFNPKVVAFTENKIFGWKGKLFLPKIFDGKHVFELEQIDSGKTRLKHYEEFSGILVWIILKFIGEDTEKGFIAMNEALKKKAETLS